jgi:hypothetical protein
MMKLAMSPAAATLVRALMFRSEAERNRILLTEVNSTDWQSLTFAGERHRISLRIIGEDSAAIAERLCCGLEDAELSSGGTIVADIAVVARGTAPDGATELTIEALTIADD